jgi:GxxExxY protein
MSRISGASSESAARARQPGWLAEEKRVHSAVGGFYDSYNELGFGFVEPICTSALVHELVTRGHTVRREVAVPVMYKGECLGRQRLDLLVDERIIVEVKATAHLPKDATRQLYNYLRATSLEVGLLLHYGVKPRFYRVFCASDRR